ncbi:hypothetical protein BMS3Bbin11_01457 [bacterium BMS3Bbin11]|nr:hypothetical protein BMS3Abin11_01315 [bacterium BMS3Abin11]GBE46357.1 hypothetical protein BMS3Bbin11_01457 [bacterium BMS3Bbin11]GMT41322.1 MAG: hypothetical protein IEMM0001_2057 [bacterium]HDH16470.1 hypothetical protein [Gammaproteobacteria bacterium]HDZ79158.1 hypothetical protein [Gammaproteobacteria bacterium]
MKNKPLKLTARSVAFGITVILTVFSNSSWAEKDNRVAVVLDDENRAFVLHEMRQNVSGLQQAITALSKDDMKGVASALRPLGMQSMASVPPTLMSSVPGGFMQIGMPNHLAFDKIADAAEKGASTKDILSSLGMAMNRCVACHAAYRIESK